MESISLIIIKNQKEIKKESFVLDHSTRILKASYFITSHMVRNQAVAPLDG